MAHFTAYIDEAGDEGFGQLRVPEERGGQSTWLMIGGFILRTDNDHRVPGWKRELRDKFPEKRRPDLHWQNLNHDQRVVTSEFLASFPINVALTLSHKVTIPGSRYAATFKRPQYLYNYLVRWLLERLIDGCRRSAPSEKNTLRVVFSKRGGTDYDTMRDYLRMLAKGDDLFKAPRTTDWSILDIDGIEVEAHSAKAGLQIADLCVGPFFSALEPNRFNNYETRYGEALAPRLLRARNLIQNVGLTVVPSMRAARCDERQKAFLERIWRSGQAPGP